RMSPWSTAFGLLACCALVGVIVSTGGHSAPAQAGTPPPTPTPPPSPTPTPITAIGGVSLLSTVSIPLQPLIQPVANLCRDLVIESVEDEWQLSHSSVSLGTLSNEVPAFDILQRTLIVQKCT